MKSRLLSSSTQKTTRVVIRLITVPDAHRVHVFTSRPVLTHQADSAVVRMTTKAASVPRALVPVCRVSHVHRESMVSHVAAIVPVHNMVSSRKAAISHVSSRAAIVLVLNTDSSRKAVTSLASNRAVIVLVLNMDSSRKAATSPASSRAIVPVLSTVSRAATSKVAISPVAVISRAVTTPRVAIRDVLRAASLPRKKSRSHTIPMPSTR